ncbi:MAG: class I SAM-dependent methyltransferase [Candidatus Shapirobacteria bacterium]|jgi:ubiquinone/menaquinone biosynthesis C-methylase UbiE
MASEKGGMQEGRDKAREKFRQSTPEERERVFGEGYFWGEKSNYYGDKGYRGFDSDRYWEPVTEVMKRYLEDRAGSIKYLDVGGACGYLAKRVPFRVENTHIVDISKFALDVAKADWDKTHPLSKGQRQTKQADINEGLPFPDGFFGCVTAMDILEHLNDPGNALKEIARVMEDGGLLITDVPITDTLAGKIWNKSDKDTTHISVPNREEILRKLAEAGFQVTELRYATPLPGVQLPFPRINMQTVSVKTTMSADEIMAGYKDTFPKATFLKPAGEP